MIKRLIPTTVSALAVLTVAACNEKPMAYGDANSIIAVMSAEQWEATSERVYEVLEQRVQTVRDEKAFTVTYQEPGAQFWNRLRRFRQMLVVGTPDDPWVQEAMERSADPVAEGEMVQVYDVWSRGQTVTLLVLGEGWGLDDLEPYLGRVRELLDGQFRQYARNRMYFSGMDTALADTLAMQAGFSMEFPDVYRWRALTDSIYVFRNDNPDPAELIREIVVTWITPAADDLGREELLEWRERVIDEHYSEPQMAVLDNAVDRTFEYRGHPAVEVQAQWRNPPERRWPAGGPFITRAVTCDAQDRTYMLDAWLYAPGKEKYEYMIQLETLLDTFRCDV